MNKVLNFFKKPSIVIIIILLFLVLNFFVKSISLKYQRLYEVDVVPHIELSKGLFFSQDHNVFVESTAGFVRFDNKVDQPKDLIQYYIISALNEFDSNGNQIFSLEEVIKMKYLPPKRMDLVLLKQVNKTPFILTLEDDFGNQYFIDIINSGDNSDVYKDKIVRIIDINGNHSSLITNILDYQEYILHH